MASVTQFGQYLGFDLDPFQVEACEAVAAGRNVLVAAPTGAGKTVVAQFAVEQAVARGRRAFYTTPIKALSNQKYGEFVDRYGYGQVGLLTGDISINGGAPIVVMTTEVVRNMLYEDSVDLADLGCVVLDEVHYLGDEQRGAVWEEVIIHLPLAVRLVSLSATVSNAEEFGAWLDLVRGDTAVVVSEVRPVPLFQHVLLGQPRPELYDLFDDSGDGLVNPSLAAVFASTTPWQPNRHRSADRESRQVPARVPRPAAITTLDRRGLLPAIVFIFSRAGCDAAVEQCRQAGLTLTTDAEQAEIRAVIEEETATVSSEDLAVLNFNTWRASLVRGVAAHHAGLLPLFKQVVEELFSAGLVKVVFATETLALGINMPARSVMLESLVKWNGTRHADLSPGEYTQLTGRAGRRGIDVEGHAIVAGSALHDPQVLANLSSKRVFRLDSTFRPTYNMAVNLIRQVGVARARDVLETSFAQFQADRVVVGLARQARTLESHVVELGKAMACDRGDFASYVKLREEITEIERADARARRAAPAMLLPTLREGDVLAVPRGRRSGYMAVTEVGTNQVGVVDLDGRFHRLRVSDLTDASILGKVRIDRRANLRTAKARKDLASRIRELLGRPNTKRRPEPKQRPSAERIAELRRRLRAHPCHGCPEREVHARNARARARAQADLDRILGQIETRTGSIARTFDAIRGLLAELGYLTSNQLDAETTSAGDLLAHLYTEHDLLVAECLRSGAWDGLSPAQLAGVIALVNYRGRDEATAPHVGSDRLSTALLATERRWAELQQAAQRAGLPTTEPLDAALVAATHSWARGGQLGQVLELADLSAGDFVRATKQVIDLLDQIADIAPQPNMRRAAARASSALNRGVVAVNVT
jgi:ATP-dependent RNA helicase HelY